MAGKKADTSKMSPEEKAAYEKRLEAMRAPKPAYLVFNVVDGNGNKIDGANIEVVAVTRKADDFAKAITDDRTASYTTIMIK